MRCWCGWLLLVLLSATGFAQQEETPTTVDGFAASLEQAIKGTTSKQRYALAYRFREGDTFAWEVEHVETLKTSIKEHSETVSSRTQSHSHWKVISTDSQGKATLVQTIPWIKWWQRTGDNAPIEFDTRSAADPPDQYAHEAKKAGVPFAAISVQTNGKITKPSDAQDHYDFGAGSFWIPLPMQPIPVGQTWTVPNELIARGDDNSYKRIKTQVEYKLAAVHDGLARIEFATQILTPLDSPKVHSQICQQLTSGHVTFDLSAGEIVDKKVNWNEKVIGFHGDDSLTHYLGEYTIRRLDARPATATAKAPTPVIAKPLQIRTRDDGPIFRR